MALHGELCRQFDEGQIADAIYDPKDELAHGFNALGAALAAVRCPLWRAGLTSADASPHSARWTHEAVLRRLPT